MELKGKHEKESAEREAEYELEAQRKYRELVERELQNFTDLPM